MAALSARYGVGAVFAAQAAAESGLTVTRAADQTHWATPADRDRFVRAYVEMTREVSDWRELHEDAARVADRNLERALRPYAGFL
ncbi:MAG: hypothetical protein HOY78_31985 [Saccharothrix sp.]|nr:hypothetical protein [Saccharothrix sp.]